jgi:hypothetical protein
MKAETTKHITRVVQEATVVSRRSIRSRCTCGWYGSIFTPDERDGYAEAAREGLAHEKKENRR